MLSFLLSDIFAGAPSAKESSATTFTPQQILQKKEALDVYDSWYKQRKKRCDQLAGKIQEHQSKIREHQSKIKERQSQTQAKQSKTKEHLSQTKTQLKFTRNLITETKAQLEVTRNLITEFSLSTSENAEIGSKFLAAIFSGVYDDTLTPAMECHRAETERLFAEMERRQAAGIM